MSLACQRDRGVETYNGSYHRDSYQVLLYEFKDGLNRYFTSLGSGTEVHSLEELIKFNEDDPVELEYFRQDIMIGAAVHCPAFFR